MGDIVLDAGVLHLVDNSSDHCVIYCVIDIGGIITEEPKVSHAAPKPSWKNASQEQKESYKAVLEQKLESISLSNDAKDCQDVKCKNENHCMEVDHFMVDILDSIESASFQTLPVNNSNPSRKQKNVPGYRSADYYIVLNNFT